MEGGEPVLLTHERSEGQDHFQLPTTAVAGWCAGGALTGAGEYSVWATYSEERPKIREKLCGAATRSKCPLGSTRGRLPRLLRAHLTALAGPALTPKREPSPLGRRTEPALAFTSGALPYKVADSTASDHPGPAASERRLKRRKVYGFTVAAGPAAAVSLVTWLGLG